MSITDTNILVLGGKGQLGQALAKVSAERGMSNLFFAGSDSLDILRPETIDQYFRERQPDIIINCAAYTAVDKAEDEPEAADAINHIAAGKLAELCSEYGKLLIHISTDFVFEGGRPAFLNETDIAEPISVYGCSKLKGEQVIRAVLKRHIIIRTSWLYSEFGNNFVKTMLRLGDSHPEIGVIADQTGTPTYAPDLAAAILDIISSGAAKSGTYHYSNEGAISWYDFATAVFELSNMKVFVKALKTNEYPTKAKRPAYSVMDKAKIKRDYNVGVPYWRNSLKTCIAALKGAAIPILS